MKKEKIADRRITRRNLLNKIWWGLGILALIEFIGVGVAYLRPRKPRSSQGGFGSVVDAGPVDDFHPNSVTAFRKGHFYLSRLEDGGFLALSRTCTHLGCTVPWEELEKKFVCPCHSSKYDIKGNKVSSPAHRALDIYPLKIENNVVKVDTSRSIKRERFEISQVVYP